MNIKEAFEQYQNAEDFIANFFQGETYYGLEFHLDDRWYDWGSEIGWAVYVCHMFDNPRVNLGHAEIGGFKSDEDRDAYMTTHTDEDIAWVRPGREKSGTARNLERRNNLGP
jgi:hypothetical protein